MFFKRSSRFHIPIRMDFELGQRYCWPLTKGPAFCCDRNHLKSCPIGPDPSGPLRLQSTLHALFTMKKFKINYTSCSAH